MFQPFTSYSGTTYYRPTLRKGRQWRVYLAHKRDTRYEGIEWRRSQHEALDELNAPAERQDRMNRLWGCKEYPGLIGIAFMLALLAIPLFALWALTAAGWLR